MKKVTNNKLDHFKALWINRVIYTMATTASEHKSSYLITISVLALSACTQTPVKDSATTAQTHMIGNISVSTSEHEKYEKGLIVLNNNENSRAEQIFNDFLADKPDLAGPYTNLALIQFKKKNYDQSLELVNQALLRNPEQAQAYQLRGQIFLTRKKIHDAKKDYVKAIELKPDYINAHYNLALLYDIYLQEIALAIKHYETYLSLIKKPDEATREWVNHLKGILGQL